MLSADAQLTRSRRAADVIVYGMGGSVRLTPLSPPNRSNPAHFLLYLEPPASLDFAPCSTDATLRLVAASASFACNAAPRLDPYRWATKGRGERTNLQRWAKAA